MSNKRIMFCPNCGNANQEVNSYCRNCGTFLTDGADNLYLLSKLFSLDTPERQINANLTFNFVGFLLSLALFGFLLGSVMANLDKNPSVSPPTITYFVLAFLLVTAVWQFVGSLIGLSIKNKFNGRNPQTLTQNKIKSNETFEAADKRDLLPEADTKNIVPNSVVEETTKILTKK